MSLAQVDLMCTDVSVTVYPKTNKETKTKGKHDFKDMSTEEIEAKRKEWNERYGGGKHRIKVNI